jgi:pyruvate ferredoxin oxidoreductase alpha subunit
VVEELRAKGKKVGLVQIKMFRPFPAEGLRRLIGNAKKVGVLDRNYAAGIGGVFCHDVKASLQSAGKVLVQGYLTGVGGGDVVPEMVREVVADLEQRQEAGEPVWKGIDL